MKQINLSLLTEENDLQKREKKIDDQTHKKEKNRSKLRKKLINLEQKLNKLS